MVASVQNRSSHFSPTNSCQCQDCRIWL